MKLLKGKAIADKILNNLKKRIKQEKLKPALVVLLIGENKASKIYVKLKKEAAKKIRMDFFVFRFKAQVSENKIMELIKHANRNRRINGIIVQLPLPKKFNTRKIINSINPQRDVDGFGPETKFRPVFPQAILEILKSTKTKLRNKRAVIIANSKTFGDTMKKILEKEKVQAQYALILRKEQLKNADIIISAVGKPGLIKGDMVKRNAIIIDGGITKIGKKVLGDVDFNSVKNKASFITPVPGGVGPVTIACLLKNVYLAAKKSL